MWPGGFVARGVSPLCTVPIGQTLTTLYAKIRTLYANFPTLCAHDYLAERVVKKLSLTPRTSDTFSRLATLPWMWFGYRVLRLPRKAPMA